jgi:hypothetical protein
LLKICNPGAPASINEILYTLIAVPDLSMYLISEISKNAAVVNQGEIIGGSR